MRWKMHLLLLYYKVKESIVPYHVYNEILQDDLVKKRH